MKTIHFSANDSAKQQNLAICLGFFDGIHLAHQRLLEETIKQGKERGLKTAMLSFSTHIISFLKGQEFLHISSLEDKAHTAKEMGFDYFYVLDVSSDLVKMDPEVFIERFLKEQDVVVVGFDFTFGFKGAGNPALLKQHTEFETIVIEEMDFEDEKIGSTRIRECIQKGCMEEVSAQLGKPYSLKGEVIKGKSRGKAMGFPTANLSNLGYLPPRPGVYVSIVESSGVEYKALANVGYNPTFGENALTVEAHILDYDGPLYGKLLTLSFLHYIREEIKFDNVDDLVLKMREDEMIARKYFFERGIL